MSYTPNQFNSVSENSETRFVLIESIRKKCRKQTAVFCNIDNTRQYLITVCVLCLYECVVF